MLWPYGVGAAARSDPARIDRWLPRGARRLEHHSIDVAAEPDAALGSIGSVRLSDVPIVRALFAMRGIPYLTDMTLERFFGTPPFLVLDEEPGRELVFGVVGPFWHWWGGSLPAGIPRTPEEFRAALAAGRMAGIGNFRVEPNGGGSRVWTETWVFTPGSRQAVPFVAYWMVVGPFSAWIRRIFLRAGRREAEVARRRGSRTAGSPGG